MYTLADVRNEYDRLDEYLGISTKNIKLTVSKRMTRTYGMCKYGDDCLPREISLADFLFKCEEQFWDTIRHEYAHAYVKILCPSEHHGHDKYWKAACCKIGCKPERLADNDEARKYSALKRNKYSVKCCTCGNESFYSRKGEVVKILLGESKKYSYCVCNNCNGRDFTIEILNNSNRC